MSIHSYDKEYEVVQKHCHYYQELDSAQSKWPWSKTRDEVSPQKSDIALTRMVRNLGTLDLLKNR